MFDPKQLQEVEEGNKCYEEAVAKTLAKNPERKENFTTGGGIPLKRTYTPKDLEGLDYSEDLGFPGQYPYTRGVQPRCTAAASGRCASMPVLRQLKIPTNVTAIF